jgi:hypothetical protein
MDTYCNKNQIVDLQSMNCVDTTLETRIINNKIFSRNPLNYNKISQMETIGEGVQGIVYKVCFPNVKDKCFFNLVKKVVTTQPKLDINKRELDLINKNIFFLDLYKKDLIEIYMMNACTNILNEKITQNLPYLYGYKVAKNSFSYMSEFINDGTFKNWITTKERTNHELDNAYFQIFHAAYCIYKYTEMYHDDLHWENVLILKIKKGGFFRYKIKNKTYDVPNLGYIFIVTDFGLSAQNTNKLYGLFNDISRIARASSWAFKQTGMYQDGPFRYAKSDIKTAEDIFIPFKVFTKKIKGKPVDTFESY